MCLQITAVISGSIMYGATAIARVRFSMALATICFHPDSKKFLFPYLQPPASTVYEADKDALSAQFDAAEAILKEIQAETKYMHTALQEQTSKINQTTEEVGSAVRELRDNDVKTRTEIQEIKEEIVSIRELLPKVRF